MIHWGHVPRSNTDRDSTAGSKGSTRSKKYKAKTEGNNLSPIWLAVTHAFMHQYIESANQQTLG
ncbi:hypothetical protein JHK86_019884 [Glycine max]|nr:hypothetical protein JHK86_019884 [Glycine max]